jgi:hypothetical protein
MKLDKSIWENMENENIIGFTLFIASEIAIMSVEETSEFIQNSNSEQVKNLDWEIPMQYCGRNVNEDSIMLLLTKILKTPAKNDIDKLKKFAGYKNQIISKRAQMILKNTKN